MNLQQLNQRVQIEADARFGETIEHLLFLLDYEERMKDCVRRCYCKELRAHGMSYYNWKDGSNVCENCK